MASCYGTAPRHWGSRKSEGPLAVAYFGPSGMRLNGHLQLRLELVCLTSTQSEECQDLEAVPFVGPSCSSAAP